MSDIDSIINKRGLVKVPKETAESKYRRVAKFLFLIGPKQAAEVLKKLDDVQVEKVVAELVTIRSIDKAEALIILDEFNQIYEEHKNSIGGPGVAREILCNVYGEQKADEIMERAIPPKPIRPFSYLKGVGRAELAYALKDELPSVVAVVLSYLPPRDAADYLSSLSDETQKKDIVLHLAKMEKLNTDVIQAVSDALRKKLVALSLDKTFRLDGKLVLAKILRNSNLETEKSILQGLSIEDQDLADDIIKHIYTIDDILVMSEKDVQYLLAQLSDTEIRYLIFNKTKEIRQKILANISKNKALFILDDEKKLDEPLPKNCLDAEKTFMTNMINEARKGNIIIPKDESEKLVY